MQINTARIKKERVLKGWSQSRLAKEIDKKPSTISMIENGDIVGLPETIKAIAEALDIPMEELILDDQEKLTA